MDDTTPDLTATVEQLTAEVARLRALVEPTVAVPNRPDASLAAPIESPSSAPIDRRSALRRAGFVAAGAVAGGAAIVAGTASPAAAATVSGSGNPGVSGTGTGGDGVAGTTNAAFASGVYGSTSTAGAYGVFARHSGPGVALGVEGNANGADGVAVITSLSPSPGLVVNGSGRGVVVNGGVNPGADTVTVKHGNDVPNSGTAVNIQTYGNGVTVFGPGGTVEGAGAAFRAGELPIGISIGGCGAAIYLGGSAEPPPTRTTMALPGMIDFDGSNLWLCILGGIPGTWRRLGGYVTAGAFQVLAAPARVYDSRPGSVPSVGLKTKLVPNQARTIDLKANSSGVPIGATAALLTVLLVNAANANGNATVWANGVNKPQANTLVWGGSSGRFTATAVSAVDSQGRIQVAASHPTDVVVDVVGYYR